jgi:tRNA(fMet)-specific endonuclease VapC
MINEYGICYDTNILILLVRDNSSTEQIRKKINPDNNPEYISYVSAVELRSFAYKNNWGINRLERIEYLLESLNIIEINTKILTNKFIEIDAYSQGKHKYLRSDFLQEIWVNTMSGLLQQVRV